jgi:hypothetical protein
VVDTGLASLRRAVGLVRSAVLGCLTSDTIEDVVFIGNSSEAYEWVPSRIVDFDCFVFTRSMHSGVGRVLEAAGEWAQREVNALGVDLELRVIRGAYKPDRSAHQPPIICIHAGVFDEERYGAQPALHRWSWKKYPCVVEPDRLRRLAPPKPTLEDLLEGPRGVRERLTSLEARSTEMIELLLPSMAERRLQFAEGTPQFVEFCYSSAASCARHHARILGHAQADALGNEDFFAWYFHTVLADDALTELIELKARSRDAGFAGLGAVPRRLATSYLSRLLDECCRTSAADSEDSVVR